MSQRAVVGGAGRWKRSSSPCLRLHAASLALSAGRWGSRCGGAGLIDSSICVSVIMARLIGRKERWDIVITDTTLTRADGTSGGLLLRRGGTEARVRACVFV